MLLLLYRFLRGWLKVQFYGHNVSRFLNLCTRHGVELWSICTLENNRINARMYAKDLFALRSVFRKTKVRFRILSRRGLPFFIHRYRRRKVFAGIIVCVIAGVVFLSAKIWRIEFVGNSSISDETLLEYLSTHQIQYGTSRTQIDNDALELSLRQDFDPIIWASVYEEGTKLVVCIQEKIVSDRAVLSTEDTPMDLVATKDAQVESIITRKGIGMVKAGNTVKKGDILVSGRQEICDDSGEVREYYYETADADVMGKVAYDYEDWIEQEVIKTSRTGQTHKRFFMRIGEYQFTSPVFYAQFDDSSTIEQSHQLCLMDSFYLPVYYGEIIDYEEKKATQRLDFDEAKVVALEHLEYFLTNLEQNGVSIIDKNVMIEKIEQKYHVYGTVNAVESITKQQPTEILPNPVSQTEEQQEE